MAIAFVAASNGTTGSGTSLTFAYTCGSGANRLLVVGILGGSGGDTITGVTYNSVAMTQVNKRLRSDGRYVYHYYLLNPSSGANNVVASFSDSTDFNGGCAADYTGVKQSAQPDASATNSGTGVTTLTTSVTTVADNSWVIGIASATSGESNLDSGDAGTTARTSSNVADLFDKNAAVTPAGGATIIVVPNNGAPCNIYTAIASYAPAADATTTSSTTSSSTSTSTSTSSTTSSSTSTTSSTTSSSTSTTTSSSTSSSTTTGAPTTTSSSTTSSSTSTTTSSSTSSTSSSTSSTTSSSTSTTSSTTSTTSSTTSTTSTTSSTTSSSSSSTTTGFPFIYPELEIKPIVPILEVGPTTPKLEVTTITPKLEVKRTYRPMI